MLLTNEVFSLLGKENLLITPETTPFSTYIWIRSRCLLDPLSFNICLRPNDYFLSANTFLII